MVHEELGVFRLDLAAVRRDGIGILDRRRVGRLPQRLGPDEARLDLVADVLGRPVQPDFKAGFIALIAEDVLAAAQIVVGQARGSPAGRRRAGSAIGRRPA